MKDAQQRGHSHTATGHHSWRGIDTIVGQGLQVTSHVCSKRPFWFYFCTRQVIACHGGPKYNERTQDKDKHTDTQPQDMLGVRCHQSCLAKAPSGFTSAQDRSFGAAQASPIAGR